MKRSILLGILGFTTASLVVFCTVAFGERWMYRNLGVAGSYATWAVLFVVLGGVLLSPLVNGTARITRFLPIFAVGFFLYSAGWIAAYFTFRGTLGAWVGSLAGSTLLALVIAKGFGSLRSFAILAAILFAANSAGYFIGEKLFLAVPGRSGMVLWGLIYGIGLGAGLGLAVDLAQSANRRSV
jgi:hypothetical protein